MKNKYALSISITLRRCGNAAVAFTLLCLSSSLFAQSDIAQKQERAAFRRQAVLDAAGLALVGDFAGGEEALAELTGTRPGTPQWHLHMGSQWVQVLETLKAARQYDSLVPVASRALVHLQTIPRMTRDRALQKSAFLASARLHERILGSRDAAEADYRSALLLDAQDSEVGRKVRQFESERRRTAPALTSAGR